MYPTSSSKPGSSYETSFPIDPPPTPVDPPPTCFPESFPYDVFLSFRGIDTRNVFAEHLYRKLYMVGIRTFMDDDQLEKGRKISLQLERAIDESRIYIVVFSPNYGTSRWCLNELTRIKDRIGNRSGRVLYPVFYNVEPSDIRHQQGEFGDAFKQAHKSLKSIAKSTVEDWENALRFAADRSGFNLQKDAFGSSSRLIDQIVKEVLADVKPKTLFVAKYPIGLDSRADDISSLLSFEPNNQVQIIGIWGMGGSGKSTVVKALYNKILQFFESSCFLSNVRENSLIPNGLEKLQEKLISSLLIRSNIRVNNIDEGMETIGNRLCQKKVLVVLDDIDKREQINALAGDRCWFGEGSVIIITTRDQHLLDLAQVVKRYEAKTLNNEESLELFNWHSFQTPFTKENYASIAKEIISYCGGLPLALEVLGAFLFGRKVHQWNNAFVTLQNSPLPDIQKVLQISYDGLDDQAQREIFLDIACFFIGKDMDYVTNILNRRDFSSEIGIEILQDRCLLTVNENKLSMHDMIREMGRSIVFQPFPSDPGKRSRLWNYLDAKDVIMGNTGTKAIEGLALVSPIKEEIDTTKSLEKMKRLRLLQFDNVSFHGSYINISENIKWLSWRNFSLERLPSGLQLQNLAVLDMQHSKLWSIWPTNTFFNLPKQLKILNLSHSKFLTSTPDFRQLPDLVTLILEGCINLLEIDPSIGCLDKLLVLSLKGCLNLQELPNNLGDIKQLRELYADETALTNLPSSLQYLTKLKILSLRKCAIKDLLPSPMPKLWYESEMFPAKRDLKLHVKRLNLRDCNLSYEDIPSDIGDCLCHLRELDLAGNMLTRLPLSFAYLTGLESLWLDDWSILTSIPDLPPNLRGLIAKNVH